MAVKHQTQMVQYYYGGCQSQCMAGMNVVYRGRGNRYIVDQKDVKSIVAAGSDVVKRVRKAIHKGRAMSDLLAYVLDNVKCGDLTPCSSL